MDVFLNLEVVKSMCPKVTVVILTKNEGKHLGRAIDSVRDIASEVFVVDSGSTDNTIDIALSKNACVLRNEWVNHAAQFNWALDNLPEHTEWVLRLDADEVLSRDLSREINMDLPSVGNSISGIYLPRRINFLGKDIRWGGGVFPAYILRLFRFRFGHCEDRVMDEHIVVVGETLSFRGEIIDHNLNSLSWWSDKHNRYSSLEAVELLNLEFSFFDRSKDAPNMKLGRGAGLKRWVKNNVYFRLPVGFRAGIYFFYRFILRFGFLDGRIGLAFHFLQGFWYRYLVDLKVFETKKYMSEHEVSVEEAILRVLDFDVYHGRLRSD